MSEPLLLCRRLAPAAAPDGTAAGRPPRDAMPPPSAAPDVGDNAERLLVLALSASERQRLRGHCLSLCGRDLLLQLPREGGALQPQERLAGDDGVPRVRVEAAPEELLLVHSDDPFKLLRAAYHLGNRHVALELHLDELRLPQDPVLAELLRGLGVSVAMITAPFQPESGAYAAGHGHGPADEPGEAHGTGHGAEAHGHDSPAHSH